MSIALEAKVGMLEKTVDNLRASLLDALKAIDLSMENERALSARVDALEGAPAKSDQKQQGRRNG
jgi:hypothetical protein